MKQAKLTDAVFGDDAGVFEEELHSDEGFSALIGEHRPGLGAGQEV